MVAATFSLQNVDKGQEVEILVASGNMGYLEV